MSTNPREEMAQFFKEFGVPFTIWEDPETGDLCGSTDWVVELPARTVAERRSTGGRRPGRRPPR